MRQSVGITTTMVPEVRLLALGLAVWLMGSVQPGLAQSGPPSIVAYKFERTTEDGRQWLSLGWEALNVDRVILLHDEKELSARIQLPDGSFGWPPTMPIGAFKTTGLTGTYTLVAENQHGRVQARAKLDDTSCHRWLVPPGTHWERCRKGGVIAENLSTTPSAGPPRCTVEGRVTSSVNFIGSVPDSPLNPKAGATSHRLDQVVIRRRGQPDYVRVLRLSGRAGRDRVRTYKFNGVPGDFDYVVHLAHGFFRSKPPEVAFHCPSTPGQHRIELETLHNDQFVYDY